MKVRKKENIILDACKMSHSGTIKTDRGEALHYQPGDYVLMTEDGREWPVSEDYFLKNYEEVKGA